MCFSSVAVAKVGLKQISNDVERCLSLVRCQLFVHCFLHIMPIFFFFSHAFTLSVCGRKDARTIISYNSVVQAGLSNCLLLAASTFLYLKFYKCFCSELILRNLDTGLLSRQMFGSKSTK